MGVGGCGLVGGVMINVCACVWACGGLAMDGVVVRCVVAPYTWGVMYGGCATEVHAIVRGWAATQWVRTWYVRLGVVAVACLCGVGGCMCWRDDCGCVGTHTMMDSVPNLQVRVCVVRTWWLAGGRNWAGV